MELASLQEKLKEEGWNLSNSGIELISENGKITDVKSLVRKAIDVDLKSISQGTLPEDINKTKYEQIPGNIVLQIQKIKNLSSPKSSESNSTSTSILKLNLTDGVQNVQAIQMDSMPNIHMNTFPGSKIHITSENIDISHCFLLLFNSSTQFLGGRVDSLVEKWELNKRLAKHTRDRGVDEGGPPPWIGFGQKLVRQTVSDKNFKSLDLAKNKESLENSEFEAQRKGAILEATKIGCTKVFGGGNNKLLDYNVQQIVDAGFTIEDAEYALKISKNNLDKALRNLQNKYNKSNKDDNSKSNKAGNEENKKGGKGRNRHRDEESALSLKPSGKVSLFDFLEDKLPFSEPPVETKPLPQEKRNGVPFKGNNKPNFKQSGKAGGDDRRTFDRPDTKNQKKSHESSKQFSKFEFADKRNYSEKKSEFGKFESKKNFDRTDKSFGNFKGKYETKNGEYSGRNEVFKSKSNDKRGQSNVNQSAIKSYGRSMDLNENKKTSGFTQANEKPPRFQKYQNHQQNDTQGVQNWNDHAGYNRISQSEYQLQNTIANLTLQQNIANFQNQNSQDGYGDVLSGVAASNTKPNNLFYQNVVIPTSQSNDNRIIGNQNSQPPPPHQSHLNTYGNRNVSGFIHQEVKNSSFPSIPSLQDVAFKNNGPLLHGYNDFQSVFGNARAPSSSYPNPQYMANPNGMPPQSHKTWIWNKGDKCMAKYWEDQMYYNAVVTAVSESTCVVRFTDYGNYEEVLQDHCIPITEES